MELPDLVQQELGDEEITSGVSLGDEDVVCFTPTRALVYRGEGLLSDEKVNTVPYDFERLKVSVGRRKTKLTLFYTDRKQEVGVPGDRADSILERLLEGKLRRATVIGDEEDITGVFRFSELTLVVTDTQLLRHLGNVTWDADFESYSFEHVTGLDFEEGSVATVVVLSVDGRPERIKTPSDQAATVRQTLEDALFSYHDVSSLAALNETVTAEPDDSPEERRELGLETGIDPLVGNDSPSPDQQERPDSTPSATETVESSPEATPGGDIAALETQVAELTAAIERQNERIEQQEQMIQQLISELRQGR